MPFDAKPPKSDIEKAAEALAPPVLDNVELLARDLEQTRSFNLQRYAHDCGTPACIAGHAVARWPGIRKRNLGDLEPDYRLFAEHIGLSVDGLRDLCLPLWRNSPTAFAGVELSSPGRGNGHIAPGHVTGKMAAAALRRLRDTGEAYFDLADA